MSGAVEVISMSLPPAPFPERNSSLPPLRIEPDETLVDLLQQDGQNKFKAEDMDTRLERLSPTKTRFPVRQSSLSPLQRAPVENLDSPASNTVDSMDDAKESERNNRGRAGLDAEYSDSSEETNFRQEDMGLRHEESASSGLKDTVDDSERHYVSADKLTTFSKHDLKINSVGEGVVGVTPGYEPRLDTAAENSRHSLEMSTRRPRPPQSLSSRLRRTSWLPSSRSPSPRKTSQSEDFTDDSSLELISNAASGRRDRLSTVIVGSGRAIQRPPSLSKQFANKLRKRQSSFTALDTLADTQAHSKVTDKTISAIPKSFSADRLSSAPLVMPTRSSDRLSALIQPATFSLSSKARHARKRDELWSAFRELDSACGRFHGKTSEQKANIVKSTLLPFLQEHACHRSNINLHAEDLDRRLAILHNWWVALLDFIKSGNFTAVTNHSKVAILDSVIEIMERPEWKHPLSPFCPTNEAITDAGADNDFLVESVQHNLKNWFTQCLLTQMTIVIEKMSVRTVPSVTTFCGKTCAYAFFFCPGIAAVLIRLWGLKYSTLKRVMEENGVESTTNFEDTAIRISLYLPPALKNLHFSTLQKTHAAIRTPASYPLGTQDSQWKGAWVDRWSGQDSELFYIFVKQYYLMLSQYLPESSKLERLVAAGGIFIQAQILVNLDATICKRFPKTPDLSSLPPLQSRNPVSRLLEEHSKAASITFDDMLGEPDGVPPSMAFASLNIGQSTFGSLTNAERQLSENRLILLLKEMLATDDTSTPKNVRETFASILVDLLRATAKATHQFNRFETDTLFMFLEEILLILIRYERTYSMETSFLDWDFWFGVWKLMSENDHFQTEAKILSLIYTLWPAIALDKKTKEKFCYEYLLEKDAFEHRFFHWSALVRSYFMRLICWRVARVHEDCDETEL
jgi:Protein of unknown function (DUF1765)